MKQFLRISILFSIVLLFGAAPVLRANGVDQFLEDVSFTLGGYGPTNALKKIDARLAKGDLAGDDRGRVLLRKLELLDQIKTGRWELGELADREFFQNKPLSPKLKVAAFDVLAAGCCDDRENELDVILVPALREILADPVVQKNDNLFIEVNMKLGARYAARSFHDLAVACYRAAADRLTDPGKKAEALFAAALSARQYRDRKTSAACLDAIGKIPGIPFEVQKRALLIRGENAIYPDQFDWKPTMARVNEAKKYISDAFADRSPLLGTPESSRVLASLVIAQAKAGDPAGAAAYGKEYLENPIYEKKVDYYQRWRLPDAIAQASHMAGNYKDAVKYYEIVTKSSCPDPKDYQMRIANSARAMGDFFRAMQAYSDAVKFCNPEEQKAEIEYLANQIKIMNKSVRKGSAAIDSEAIFSDTNEELDDLTLDEE